MRNPINNYSVYNPKLEPVLTEYPKVLKTSDGEQLVNVPTPDDSFTEMSASEFSLQSLIKAGIDPSSLRIDTSSFNAVNDVPKALDAFTAYDAQLNTTSSTSEPSKSE